MEQYVGSPESSQVQSKIRTESTARQHIETSPMYFDNEDVGAKTSTSSNHDLVQKALELASVSPYKINRQSGTNFKQQPEVIQSNEGSTEGNLKYTLLKSNKDHLYNPIPQNLALHSFIDRRFNNVHTFRGNELNTNKYAKLNIREPVPNVSGVVSTQNNIYLGHGDRYMPFNSTLSLQTDVNATSSGLPMMFQPSLVPSDFPSNSSFIQRVIPEKNNSELKYSSRTEQRPVSFFQRLTQNTNQVSESHKSISDPSEESLVSLIDSVNEFSESQSRCMTGTSPLKQGSFDLLASSISPQSKTETSPTNEKKLGRSKLQTMECSVCHKRISILSLKIHMKEHSRDKQQTGESNIRLLTDNRAKRKVNHQPKRYNCPVCRKRFTRRSYLKVHRRIHTGENPFSCSMCKKKFKYKRSLIEHVADHKQIKLYHCDICGKDYSRQSAFDAHRRNHRQQDEASPRKDIVIADKKSMFTINTKDPLDTDNSVVNDVSAALDSQVLYSKMGRGFTCSICKKYLAKEHLMRTHIKSHELNSSQNYTCSLCDEKITSLKSLKSHVAQHAVDIYNKSLDVVSVPETLDVVSVPKSLDVVSVPQSLDVVSLPKSLDVVSEPNSLNVVSVPDRKVRPVTRSVSGPSVEEISNLPDTANPSSPKSVIEFDSQENKALPDRKEQTINKRVKPITANKRVRKRKIKPTKKMQALRDYELDIDYASDDFDNQITVGFNALPDDVNRCQDDGDENVVFCGECGKVLKSEYQLKLHLKTHKPKFVCMECGREYTTQYNFQKHMTWHETKQEVKKKRDRKVDCEICAKSVRLDCLKTHIRTHTGERPYQCDFCGTTFKQPSHLKTHLTIHTGEKRHQCIYCGQVFRKTGNLAVHMRNHTGEKPYKCNTCSKSFKHLAVYKEHLASHRGIFLYQCEVCGHKYKSRSGYDSHKRKIHKEDSPYKCYSCDVIYKTSKEVMGCPCSDNTTSTNKCSIDAPAEHTATEEVVSNDNIKPSHSLTDASLTYTDVHISLAHTGESLTHTDASGTYTDASLAHSDKSITPSEYSRDASPTHTNASLTYTEASITHTDTPMSLVYSNMMRILNHTAANENDIPSSFHQ